MNILLSLIYSSLSKSCYYNIRQLRCIRPYLDFKTASTIATSIVHYKLDYCNSLPKSQITRLQHIQNSLAYAVVKASKSCHITPIFHPLYWLKANECIQYKVLSLTYNCSHNLSTYLPSQLDLGSTPRGTRSSPIVTLPHP